MNRGVAIQQHRPEAAYYSAGDIRWCPPSHPSLGDQIGIFLRYVERETPDPVKATPLLLAGVMVALALQDAYPCRAK
jgi:hypothetical protein